MTDYWGEGVKNHPNLFFSPNSTWFSLCFVETPNTNNAFLPRSFSDIFGRNPVVLRLFFDFRCQGGQALHVVCTSKGAQSKLSGLFFLFRWCVVAPPTRNMYVYIYITLNIQELKNGCSNWMIANIYLGNGWKQPNTQWKRRHFRIKKNGLPWGAIHSVLPTGACWATGHSKNGCPKESPSQRYELPQGWRNSLLSWMDMEYSTESSQISGT